MNKIIEIWDKQSTAVLEEQGFFCQLTDLDVSKCEKLMHVFHSKMHLPIKNLKVLRVSDCPTMEGIVQFEGEIDEDGLRNEVCFSELSSLELSSLPNLKSFCAKLGKAGTTEGNSTIHALPLFNGKVAFPVLETLKFKDLHTITRIWDNQQPLSEAKSFSELKIINVGGCEHLEYVFPFYMLPQLKKLQELSIQNCTRVKVIISNNLKEKEATNNNDTIRFPQLKTLELEDLPNFKSFVCCETQLFFSNKVSFPVLESLDFKNLSMITRIWDEQPLSEQEKEAKSFCKLMVIKVEDCDQLEYVLPSYALPQLNNLQNLTISGCTKMEVIISNNPKEKEAANNTDAIWFPQLKEVRLWGLPNLKSFICIDETQLLFSNKVIFPVLKKLSIQKVHKIIEIWDKQSIAILEEQGSFCRLKDLEVSECEKLMHVFPSKMQSPLKNLKVLRVSDCPTMEGIVEFEGEIDEDGLGNELCFSKLSSLELSGLANLESFYTKLEKAGTTEGNSIIHALPLFNRKVGFPVLESLKFEGLYNITRIWDNQPLSEPEKEAKSFCQLMKIDVDGCGQLEYVLPLYMLPQLKNLQRLYVGDCRKMEVIISNNPKEKEAINNNDTIRFPQLKTVSFWCLPNLKSFICSETQLFFSNKDAFPVLEEIDLDEDSEILQDGTYTKENLDRPGVYFCTRTIDDNALTNVVEIYNSQSGAVHFTVANNDGGVRDFDMENFQLSKHFSFPWPVNHTSLSPDGKLRIIVGDIPEGMLVESGTGKTVASLVGHLDFSFASAWHPDGLTFATGNQDKTCRIWDARNLSKSVTALKGNLGAIRSIRYSSDGHFMAMAEAADFVHVFDAKSGYEKEQEIDFFGEISGMSFSPDTESLFIGVCDSTYGSGLGLLEFGRRRNNSCPDSII